MTQQPVRSCPGHCCVAFYLDTPHDRLDEIGKSMRDGEQIAAMVLPLSVAEANARLERFGSDREYKGDAEGYVYTCRNFDEATRLCRIYDRRPEMCRDYPYAFAGGCEYECDFCSPPDVVGKWTLLSKPRRVCPPREPLTQR
ncbi:MAG: YkgJ family cysteine cluster protein [Gaiellaceae bacterium]